MYLIGDFAFLDGKNQVAKRRFIPPLSNRKAACSVSMDVFWWKEGPSVWLWNGWLLAVSLQWKLSADAVVFLIVLFFQGQLLKMGVSYRTTQSWRQWKGITGWQCVEFALQVERLWNCGVFFGYAVSDSEEKSRTSSTSNRTLLTGQSAPLVILLQSQTLPQA